MPKVHGFGFVSPRERREASAFFAELVGVRARAGDAAREDQTGSSARPGRRLRWAPPHYTEATEGAYDSVSWTPVRADELTSAKRDALGAWTWEVPISSLTGVDNQDTTRTIWASVFAPPGVDWTRPKVHVFFGPGAAVEKGVGLTAANAGLNAVMQHGLRGASVGSGWITIGMPGRKGPNSEANGFNTISDAAIRTCLSTAGVLGARGRYATAPTVLRYSAHSRGYRGLRETLNRNLVSLKPERVAIYDAAYTSIDAALRGASIPGSAQIAYRVTVSGRLTSTGATNIDLDPAAMRAIGYSRFIADAPRTTIGAPPFPGLVLPLVPRNRFSTRSPTPAGKTDIRAFARGKAADISAIIRDAASSSGTKTFIDGNNITRFNRSFSATIDAHHFFVAELAHEIVD